MPIFDPSQYALWGYSLPTDSPGKVRTLSPNTAGHIARLLQTLGLDTASFESTVTFPDGMTLHYLGEDRADGWGLGGPIAARREPQPGPYRSLPDLPDSDGLKWEYRPCAGARDLGRYIFTESHAGSLDSTTWAFPVAAAMGWQVDRVHEDSEGAHFYNDRYLMDNPPSKIHIFISIGYFSFTIINGKRPRGYDIDMSSAIDAQRLYVTGKTSIDEYFHLAQRYSFQHYLPERMNAFISGIQSVIDESLSEVNQW